MKIDLTKLDNSKALKIIAQQINKCRRCRLAEGRTKAVPGHGDPNTKVMFIGEGPGYNEDQQGIPFCGRAGRLLDEALGLVNWPRPSVYVTNIVKCRPPSNRDPEVDEIAACQPYLNRQIKIIKPLMIVTLGRFSMAKFLPNVKISNVHGQVYPITWQALKIIIVPLYHPAAALRNGKLRQVFFDDFKKLPGFLELAKKGFWWEEAQNQTPAQTSGLNSSDKDQLKLL
ncbi:MAG: uracil-DNA glycosylase [bacterium]|nr:uracil-DNA glycosylase [bacterium]